MTSDTDLSQTGTALVGSPGDAAAIGFAAGEIAKLQDGLSRLCADDNLVAMTGRGAGHRQMPSPQRKSPVLWQRGFRRRCSAPGGRTGRSPELRPCPAAGIALSVDTSVLTAISNDYSYDSRFCSSGASAGTAG